MLFAYSRKKANDEKLKKNFIPTYLSYFLEHVTPSAVPRCISILLTQYGHPKREPNFLKILPILFNFNQFLKPSLIFT